MVKEDRNGGRREREIECRDEENAGGKHEPRVTNLSKNIFLFSSYIFSFIE